MSPNQPMESSLQGLASELAELDDRLRLLLSGNPDEAPAWPVLAPLRVRNDLLAGLALEAGREDLAGLTRAVARLLETGQREGGTLPESLHPVLVDLDRRYETTLDRLDGGQALAETLEHPHWEWLRLRVRFLDTPLEVFAHLHETLMAWQDRWCDHNLDPADEKEMHERWRVLREYGDALFSPDTDRGRAQGGSSLLRWQGFGRED